jgi:hypothetical protein
MIATQYVDMKNSKKFPQQKNKFRKSFMNRYNDLLSGRPCIDNFLEEGMNMLLEKNFVWKGKNIPPMMFPPMNNNYNIYLHQVLLPALTSFHNTESKKKEFKQLSLNNRQKYFWDFIKTRNIHTIIDNIPVYIPVNRFDPNGKLMISLMEKNGYLNLLNN